MTVIAGGDRARVAPRLAAVAWAVAAVSVAGFAAAWVLAVADGAAFNLLANSSPDRFMIAYTVVGAVLASRRSANPIGWLLLGLGLVSAVRGLAGTYALYALTGHARPVAAVWAVWFVNWALTLLFPTGVLLFLLLLSVAAATLAAAALFNPLRRRVQRAVDRRFNRARYDTDQTVAAFAVRLKDAVDLDSVRDDLAGVVQQALEPAHLSVWSARTPGPPLSGPAGPAT
jgi:hypothetical protein